jgi:hypothetical protein
MKFLFAYSAENESSESVLRVHSVQKLKEIVKLINYALQMPQKFSNYSFNCDNQ